MNRRLCRRQEAVQWCRCRECKRITKIFDMSKIRQNLWKFGQRKFRHLFSYRVINESDLLKKRLTFDFFLQQNFFDLNKRSLRGLEFVKADKLFLNTCGGVTSVLRGP